MVPVFPGGTPLGKTEDVPDLQCPAVAVLLDDDGPAPPWLERLRVAERFTAREAGQVSALVEDGADLFRGETFVVAAPAAEIAAALRRRGMAGAAPVVVEVDSSGWRRVPAP
ncbi:hypothetical protein AUQ48_00960 [Kocuria flava]|uniref:Uncharacterized protein n=1 Tax=Kocuria flava TaxID=446860 RepID=A0A2N4SYM9_9MICC|nr:hypothetical protein AUQ48_00960 [Kocuria flava]